MNRLFTTPLTPDDDIAGFDSGAPTLDAWLKTRALRGKSRFARTYVDRRAGRIAGFYCLAAAAVARHEAPGRLRRNAPDPIPVILLGRLAVDRRHKGCGLGAALLMDALHRAAGAADMIGAGALLVHAIDEAARAFYTACAEFQEFPQGSRTLFLPLEQIRAALADAGRS